MALSATKQGKQMTGNLLYQERSVGEAFSRQATVFDELYSNNPITMLMRERARATVLKYIAPGDRILELNCGTGTDAVFFAKMGYDVLATDNSEGMLSKLHEKVSTQGLDERISIRKCSFNDLEPLGEIRCSYVFSNFGGLNCTNDLAAVLRQVDQLLLPGGHLTFVVMPVVSPWELAGIFKGRVKKAFRRFAKHGAMAHIEGVHFDCFYHDPSLFTRCLGKKYTLLALEGMASLMPPPFMDHFPEKYPRLFTLLRKIESKVSHVFPFNSWCDQYIITMQKNESK